ncbi:MAG TPA: ABC transporter permease [Edaphobacter sp.]|nr:ABC transporter permease [Edaphobacter sp.]
MPSALFKNPSLALAAIVCLALGIGANTAIYTVVNAVVLRPLAFKNAERLARIYTEFPTYGRSGGFHKFWMSTPELLDLRRQTNSWASLDAYTISGVNLSGGAEPERVTAANITGGMLPMLGVAPRLGRMLGPDDDRFGAPLTVVLSDGLWRRAFGGVPNIVGRELKINELTATVIGVMPKDLNKSVPLLALTVVEIRKGMLHERLAARSSWRLPQNTPDSVRFAVNGTPNTV